MTAPFTQSPFIVIWETTRACALACVHCRAEAMPRRDPEELTTEEGKQLIERVAAFSSPSPILVLTGGDPLRRPDIAALVAHASRIGVPVSLTPSGTAAVTQERLAALKDAGLARLAVSLDGATADAHDAFRGVRGSHRHTMRIIERAQALELPLQINTTVCRQTVNDLPALARQVAEFGVVLWALFFLIPVGRAQADQGLGADEIESVLHWAAELGRHVPFGIKTTEAPHYHRILAQRVPPAHARSGPAHRPDGVGRAGRAVTDGNGFVFVDHVGNICPSGFLPMPTGNVRRDDLVTVYREAPLFLALRDPARLGGRCGRCEYREQCGGSRARAWALTGDTLGEDPGCSHQPAAAASCAVPAISGGSDAAPSVREEQVTEALRGVFDPELGMSVVELGLIYGIEIRNGAVTITMTLTTPGCPIHDSMSEWVRQAIIALPGVERVEVRITFDPPWTPDRIQLGSDSRRLLRGGSR
ncbi:MAG TPA: TIGR04053 family radical SAM/SPASM domain-containing protein [Methylomirabilota bacterium]|nr:TIGR04053 family radical SAM/SPASM domain-containing protein [Methylomirabilota bacterium]